MFRHEHRTDRHNQYLAGYLALVAGFVNSAGFILIGTFTSHVTGNIGRFADDVALGEPSAAVLAGTMVATFFAGAFMTSMVIESNALGRPRLAYGGLLVVEAALLMSFIALAHQLATDNPRARDGLSLLLCAAMGMQNSLVTRLSGAVVRTTHLTGTVTDLGIEAARWFRYWRASIGEATRVRLVIGTEPVKPHAPKMLLLATVVATFIIGSVGGAGLAMKIGAFGLFVPIGLLLAGGIFAATRREIVPAQGTRE